jgi:steroid delta-isomerase-like uncharacterized protein
MQENTIPELVDAVRNNKLSRRQFVSTLSTMGISAVGSGAIVAASSSSSPVAARLIHREHTQENANQQLQRHDQHIMYQAQGNTQELQKDYAEDAIVDDSMYADPFVGRTAIMARKNVIIAAASDSKIQVTNRVVQGNQVTVEWVATGTHTGDLPGLPASGRAFSIYGVTVVVRRDGKIVRESLYYDVAALHRQLG